VTYTIEVQADDHTVDAARLIDAAQTTLSQQNAAPDSALTIVITDDETVAGLNRQHRGIDAPTDILSFPADPPPVPLDDEPPYLGDLIIAYPYAAAQAAREGHDLSDSLALLVVHGSLHLLGYDHDTAETRAQMWTAQAEALTALGIPLSMVPELEDDHDTTDEDPL
jgi:probable rRNA maturation factor